VVVAEEDFLLEEAHALLIELLMATPSMTSILAYLQPTTRVTLVNSSSSMVAKLA
jgi:hypothetical protein